MSTHEDPGPALQRLMLGDRLKELRHTTGLNAEEATRLLPGWYRAKLGKIEAGITRTTDSDVAELLALYQVKPDIAEDVKQLAKQARRKSPPARVADSCAGTTRPPGRRPTRHGEQPRVRGDDHGAG